MSGGADKRGESFLQKLAAEGYQPCDPAILQPAAVFLGQSGEDMRGRLLLTSDGTGEFCLRPEFTIPVSLAYLASPQAGSPAGFCAYGPVFRQTPGAAPEFLQAGLESFGRADREAADAETLGLALEAAGAAAQDWRIHIGDAGLIAALLEKLQLPPVWLRRIRGGLAKGQTIAQILTPVAESSENDGVLKALNGVGAADAQRLVEDLLKIAGISALGGRSAGEIAKRFLEQAELRSGAGLDEAKRVLLEKFFAIEGHPDKVSAELRALFLGAGLDLAAEMDSFDQRLNFIAARGVDLARIDFSAGFARNLDYYTGFVFEAGAPDAEPAIGGGRYDRLLATLGAKTDIPAVGAAIWINRLKGDKA
jgi:ATP phosphoribosyltransferase regulatory subunit